jgi:hypothetical protein
MVFKLNRKLKPKIEAAKAARRRVAIYHAPPTRSSLSFCSYLRRDAGLKSGFPSGPPGQIAQTQTGPAFKSVSGLQPDEMWAIAHRALCE